MELGQSIYDRFENGEELDEASKGLCEAIASRKESMEEYENKIEGLKGACECTRCGKMVAKDMAFCPYCGSPVAEEEDIFEADASGSGSKRRGRGSRRERCRGCGSSS